MPEKTEELQELATNELIRFFKAPRAGRESKIAREGAKLAMQTLSGISRLKATDRARDATQFEVIRSISKDPEQLRDFVSVSLPHLNPIKKLNEK